MLAARAVGPGIIGDEDEDEGLQPAAGQASGCSPPAALGQRWKQMAEFPLSRHKSKEQAGFSGS